MGAVCEESEAHIRQSPHGCFIWVEIRLQTEPTGGVIPLGVGCRKLTGGRENSWRLCSSPGERWLGQGVVGMDN